MLDDESQNDLIARAAAGDKPAFEKLLWVYYDRLEAYTLKLGAQLPQDMRAFLGAEDILQETLAQAWEDVKDLKPQGPAAFFRWLTTIADHRLLDAIKAEHALKRRGRGRRLALEMGKDGSSSNVSLLDLVLGHADTPSRSAARHEAERAVRVELARLKPAYRQALQLRFLDNRSWAEVAAQLGRSEGAVRMLCQRGIIKLREALGRSSRFFSGKS